MGYSLETVNLAITVKKGEPDIEFDLLEIELFLEEEVDGKNPREYVPKVQELFRAKGVEVSYSQAVNFTSYARVAYLEFKKKFDNVLRSDFPSVATLLPSLTESTSSSEMSSQD
jgi:hypothetical protein